MKSIKRYLILLALLAFYFGGSQATIQGETEFPTPVAFRVISSSINSGSVTLEIKLRHGSFVLCDPIAVHLEGTPGVHWNGPDRWDLNGLDSSWQTFVFNLTVPVRDTSGFIMGLTCPQGRLPDIRAFFVTTGDTLELYNGDPRESYPVPTVPKEVPPIGTIVPGEFPFNDSLWGNIQLSAASLPTKSGPAKVRLRFAPAKHPCDSLIFKVSGVNGLKIAGEHSWIAPMVGSGPYEKELDIIIPANDTSGLRVELKCGGAFHELEEYFVATDQGVTCFPWNQQKYPWRPTTKELPPVQELRRYYPTPLTDSWEQAVMFKGKSYIRYRGEIEFVEPWTMSGSAESQRQRFLDSANAIPETALFDIKLVVRDSVSLQRAKEAVPGCQYFGKEADYSIYTCRLSKARIHWLQEQRIPFMYVASQVHPVRVDTATTIQILTPDTAEVHIKPIGSMKTSLVPRTTIFTETFDATWPGPWFAVDSLDDQFHGGADYWGTSTYKYHSWPKSAWCSGVGDMISGTHYDAGQYSHLLVSLDVREYTNLNIGYSLWYDIGSWFDGFKMRHSRDGVNWTDDDIFTFGASGGWTQPSHRIQGDFDSLIVDFAFSSDIVPSTKLGAFLDDIVLTGEVKSELQPYTPPGWYDPLILSSQPGTNVSTPLYVGEPVYLDAAELNWGPGVSPGHATRIFVDNDSMSSANSWTVPELDPGWYASVEDRTTTRLDTLHAGWHQITLDIDPNDQAGETDETDNRWSGLFEWRAPAVTVRGYL
jgi:hypothetical protein